MSAIGDAGLGWVGGAFGLGLVAFWGGPGGAVFSLGGGGVFLLRTGDSANQGDELEVSQQGEEEESIEDSEEGSEEGSAGSIFLLFWGGLEGALGFGLAYAWGLFYPGGWGLFWVGGQVLGLKWGAGGGVANCWW